MLMSICSLFMALGWGASLRRSREKGGTAREEGVWLSVISSVFKELIPPRRTCMKLIVVSSLSLKMRILPVF